MSAVASPQTKMTSDCYLEGGYNGGGHAFWWRDNNINNGAGGGATHIASVTGLLYNLPRKHKIFIWLLELERAPATKWIFVWNSVWRLWWR